MGGNIGRGVLDLEPPRKNEIYVLELSSYQTELAAYLVPEITVFLNFSPDHFDRHGGHGGYFAAKARLFEQARAAVGCVVGINEDEGRYLANHCTPDQEIVHLANDRATAQNLDHVLLVEKNSLVEQFSYGMDVVLSLPDNPALKGSHNGQNMAAAYAVCRMLKLSNKEMKNGLKSFPGLPHRMEQVGKLGPVTFVNDSKATNVDAASKALGAFKNIYWIAGGVGKEGGLEGLQDFLPHIKKAYFIGSSAPAFAKMLGATPHEISGTIEEALATAAREALSDPQEAVVLLSPACASFDQFKSFEHRGDRFRTLVQELLSGETS